MKKLALLSAVFSVGVIACGGGGGDTTTPGGGGATAPATATYLAYYESGGNIYLVDPDNLDRTQIQNKAIEIGNVKSLSAVGSYDSTTGEYSDLHRHSIYWIEENDNDTTSLEGGPIYKLSLIKDDQTPQPQQISNINDACSIVKSEGDSINKKIYLVISRCGGGRVFVHSGMDNATSPIPMDNRTLISSITKGVQDPEITGFLVFNSTNTAIEECDTDLGNCTVLLQNSTFSSAGHFATNPGNGDIYICINQDLYLFNGTDVSGPIANCNPPYSRKWDSDAIYAIDAENIYKLPYGGTSWTEIYNGGDATFILTQTTNYLIVQTRDPVFGTEEVIAVPKEGGSPVLLSSGERYGSSIGIENTAYFAVIDLSTGVVKACTWTEGFSTVCQDNSSYIGFSLKTSGTLNLEVRGEIYRIRRVDNFIRGTGGGTLYAIDPQTGDTTTLGDVPDDFSLYGLLGIGDHTLLEGFDLVNTRRDVFYVNLSQENSLINITNSPDVDELPIFP